MFCKKVENTFNEGIGEVGGPVKGGERARPGRKECRLVQNVMFRDAA